MTISELDHFEFELFKKFSSHEAYPIAEGWLQKLSAIPGVQQGEISGELRRGKYSLEKIDITLAVDEPVRTLGEISDMHDQTKIISRSDENIILLTPEGIKLIIWASTSSQFASRLLSTTGSVEHLAQLNILAQKQGMRLNQDGLWKDGQLLECEHEEGIYSALGIPWIPPELRESGQKIEDPRSLELEQLIRPEDIKSDLHMHTKWSDGKNSIEEMAAAAQGHGLSIIAISDHSPYMLKKYEDASYFKKQHEEIIRIRENFTPGLTILKGVEVDILPDGSLDLPEDLLKQMDIVVASLHVQLQQPMEQITTRLIRAIENPYVNIIGHPGGRIYPMVDIADLDWERVYRAASFNQVALEINSHKSHPIFDEQKARTAAGLGTMIAMNSDSHNVGMIPDSRYGIAIARRAGLKCSQVINTWSLNHLKKWLRQKKDPIVRVQ